MSADLRELLERTAPSPSTPVDPTRIASRSRRRTQRQRGIAGLTGVALVALLAVVVWPGAVPGGLVIEDRAADQPEVPVLDLPEGWTQVQVGDAVFGIPAELEIVQVDADDPLPCDSSGNRAYLATESYPAATHDGAGNEYACSAGGNTAPQLFAAPLSAVPAAHLGDDSAWNPRPIGGLDGQWRRWPGDVAPPTERATETDDDGADVTDGGLESRIAAYRVPAVDLHLRFVTTIEEHIDLEEAILATITPVGTAGTEEAPDEPVDEQVDEPTEAAPEPGEPTRVEVDLPDGWVQVTVGDATFGVPTDSATSEFELGILELAPTDGPPCHNGLDRIGTYLAPDGYPTGSVQDRDPGGVPAEPAAHGFCRYPLATYTSILAAPLRTVPGSVREARDRVAPGDPPPATAEETLLGGLRGEVTFVGDHLVTYAIPQVDLWLEFHDPTRDPELVDQVLATVTAAEPLEDGIEPDDPDPTDADDVIWVLPGSDVRWFEKAGRTLPTEGRVIRDPSELEAFWAEGPVGDQQPDPTLRDGEVALLTTFTYPNSNACNRRDVALSQVEIHAHQATLVFEHDGHVSCWDAAGEWTVAAIVPADTRGLSGVTTVEAVERP